MKEQALGFVEVSSYVAAIEAADAMCKAADVTVRRAHRVDPVVLVICEGDVAACNAAVDAASALCRARGSLLGTNVIPRPEGGWNDLHGHLENVYAKKAARKAAKAARAAARFAPESPAAPAPAAPSAPSASSGSGNAKKKSKK